MSISIFQATVSEDGTKQIQGQVISRAIGHNNTPAAENDARFLAYVIQVKRRKFPKTRMLCSVLTGGIC